MPTKNAKKITGFDYERCFAEIGESLGYANATPEQQKVMREAIEERLQDRFMTAILSLFKPEDYALLEEKAARNPEADPFEAVIEIAEQKSNLGEILWQEVQNLKLDFTQNLKTPSGKAENMV